MFSWNFPKSAEGFFSGFAAKHVCRYLFKKKLGQFILGDIDLDQLDVQLDTGTIRLNELTVNVDSINRELGGKSLLRVGAGSIRSLLLQMPQDGDGFRIEVDELEMELLLASCNCDGLSKEFSPCHSRQDGSELKDLGKHIHQAAQESAVSTSVHEGVKAVANMIKSLLTSFHVKINNVIFAMDPSSEKCEHRAGLRKALILRIAEIECGTCISEDQNSVSGANSEDFLHTSHLTSFLKFSGATVALCRTDDSQNQEPQPSIPGSPSNFAPATTLVGERNGLSGTLSVSLPWDNGSLDIRKVDADVHIDPIDVKIGPHILEWLLNLWEAHIHYQSVKDDQDTKKTTHSADAGLTSSCLSSDLDSTLRPTNKTTQTCGSSSLDLESSLREEKLPDALRESNLINDWVPFSTGKSHGNNVENVDLGASFDQFFECFDGMRSSQSLLGSSGVWIWTCSVFSAITATSTLASGASHYAVEKQHIEANLRINLSEVSVVFLFFDEDPMVMQDDSTGHVEVDSSIHYVVSNWADVVITMQVSPREWKLEATVKNVGLDDCFNDEVGAVFSRLDGQELDAEKKSLSIKALQDDVQSALPRHSAVNTSSTFDPKFSSFEGCTSSRESKIEDSSIVKASLLKTYGTCSFQFTRTSTFSNGCFTGPSSFSLELPPLIFWVNLTLLNKILELFEAIQSGCGTNISQPNSTSTVLEEKQRNVGPCGRDYRGGTSATLEQSLQGNIFLSNVRLVLCFPFGSGGGFASYMSWDQFIALDFSSYWKTEGKAQSQRPQCSVPTSCSLYLHIAFADVYLITLVRHRYDHRHANLEGPKFSSHRVVSIGDEAGCPSVVGVLWPQSAVTGSKISKSARMLATSGEFGAKHKAARKGYEFASAATREDTENLNSQMRKEMVISSVFLLHVDLSSVAITLSETHYKQLFCLGNQLFKGLSASTGGSVSSARKTLDSQRSILIECGTLEISVNIDEVDGSNKSSERELPGSWANLKLDVHNFQLLSVSNTGGARDAKFLWLSHGEGKLCGSLTGALGKEFLLIVCNNNALGRGDGEGSNVLSCRRAGSDIVHFYDSESIHDFISVTVKCGTIVAPGGRLDWIDCICAFFRLQSPTDQSPDISMREANTEDDDAVRCSFVLNLIDVGLSYEPHCTWPSSNPPGHFHGENKMQEPVTACLLAAASLKVSYAAVPGESESEYHIKIQDLGLLVHAVTAAYSFSGDYSFGYLHKIGYVKVASETLLEVVLRMHNGDDLVWEIDCFQSHVVLRTCHDTTVGLIHLASQLQQLLAPDVEESLIHFQNRWNTIQQSQRRNALKKESVVSAHSPSSALKGKVTDPESQSEDGTPGLPDMMYGDAFRFHANCPQQLDLQETKVDFLAYEQGGECIDDRCVEDLSGVGDGFILVTRSKGNQTRAVHRSEPIEGYCLSGLCPSAKLTLSGPPSDETPESQLLSGFNRDSGVLNSGWYGNTSVQVLDDHIPDGKLIGTGQNMDEWAPVRTRSRFDDVGSFRGRVNLKNVNIRWQMFSGSDWYELRQISGKVRNACLELALSNMKVRYEMFPEEDIRVSKLCLSVGDFSLHDKSKKAPWKLVLGHYASKEHPRESSSEALRLNLEAVRPDPSTLLEEYRLHVAVLPILLHLHQSQLDFLIAFFGEKPTSTDSLQQSIVPMETNASSMSEEALLPFFQKIDIQPIILRVDYQPSRVDLAALSSGKYVELVNIIPWKGVELHLKQVQAVDVFGWKNICEIMVEEWLEDISHNQIHKLLRGLPPIRSLVAVGTGAAKLVSLPISSYKQDDKLVKGLQRGTIAFLRSVSVEAIRLGVHLAAGAHDILLHTETILACMQPPASWPSGTEVKNIRSDQPRDAQQGLQKAYESLSDGFGRTASAIVHTPMKTYQRGGGAASALATAVRGAPSAAVAPASAAAQALHCALLGVRNKLDPEHRKESIKKYSGPSLSFEQS